MIINKIPANRGFMWLAGIFNCIINFVVASFEKNDAVNIDNEYNEYSKG